MSVIFIYITTSSEDEARTIARAIVTENLAACANIIPGMHSIYRWEGKTEEAVESLLILKAGTDMFDAIERRVKELHSYDTPCIIALPVSAGSQQYLDWILKK